MKARSGAKRSSPLLLVCWGPARALAVPACVLVLFFGALNHPIVGLADETAATLERQEDDLLGDRDDVLHDERDEPGNLQQGGSTGHGTGFTGQTGGDLDDYEGYGQAHGGEDGYPRGPPARGIDLNSGGYPSGVAPGGIDGYSTGPPAGGIDLNGADNPFPRVTYPYKYQTSQDDAELPEHARGYHHGYQEVGDKRWTRGLFANPKPGAYDDSPPKKGFLRRIFSSSPKLKAPSRRAFASQFTGVTKVKCGMFPVGVHMIPEVGQPTGEWILGNLVTALNDYTSVPRKLKFLPKKKTRSCRTEKDLLDGYLEAIEHNTDLNDQHTSANAGFQQIIRAVLRYKLTNVLKRPWLCMKRPATKLQCDETSDVYTLLLNPLRGFMCSKDKKAICATWGNETLLRAISN